jgi:hypothetical protein
MKEKLLFVFRNKWFLLGVGVVVGVVIILGIRFFTYKVVNVHYHANFALYINGQKEDFKGAQYYTEVQMCVAKNVVTPAMRAHMHDNVNNVIHVEDHAVTWGDFFSNIGWTMGPTSMISPDGTVYSENGNNKLNLLLNNQDYTDFGGLSNTVIQDQNKLLVSFGSEAQTTLETQYKAIPSTASQYDRSKDPASCSGHDKITIRDRFVHAF